MDIESMQNQLFFERSEEFLKEFHMKKDEYEQWIFKDLEEFLEEKSTEYIVISPLYLTQLDMTEQVDLESLYMIMGMEKLKKYQSIGLAQLIYLAY